MTGSTSWIQHMPPFSACTSYICHECVSIAVWTKTWKKFSTNVAPLKMPMSFHCCNQIQNKMLPIGSNEAKKNACKNFLLCFVKFINILQYLLQTACNLDVSHKPCRENILIFQYSKYGSAFTGKFYSIECQIMQNADWRINNSSLSEWKGRDSPWH